MKFTIKETLAGQAAPPGERIKREEVRKMVQDYRNENPTEQKLFYAHFNLGEILDLLVDNKVFPDDIIEQINDSKNQTEFAKYGFKIYLGKYGKTAPIPSQSAFNDRITTILCLTDIVDEKCHLYADKLNTNDKVLISIGKKTNEGDEPYLDQANICPPYYAEGEPKCVYDVYYECT
ncbi:MAG: hypothetical protein ACQUHE_09040 [Bacteroidia bacterium]